MSLDMTTANWLVVAAGVGIGVSVIPMLWMLMCMVSTEVEDETALIVTNFGKVERVIGDAGWCFLPQKLLPWVRTIPVSLQRDFRSYCGIQLNDHRGTTVIVDLWIEFKITDPVKALFGVEDWEESLQSLLTHAATSILGARNFEQILSNRTELGGNLKDDVALETARWGLAIDMVYISKLSLLPEVSQLMFERVAARLEQTKADIDEDARLRIAMLEAETNVQVASLVTEAKGQYPMAIGEAYREMSRNPELFRVYKELHELSLARPHRMIAFQGFERQEISAMDAAMISPSVMEGASAMDRLTEATLNRQELGARRMLEEKG